MAGDRPKIPAEIRRRVLVEAGHRCAIPTCRYIEIDIHHIVPWDQCQEHRYENLIALCSNCHRRADRGDIDRKSLVTYKQNLRFTHDRFSQLEVDVLFQAYESQRPLQWPPFMAILLKRLLDAEYVQLYRRESGIWMNGMKTDPDDLVITQRGREFVDSLGNETPETGGFEE